MAVSCAFSFYLPHGLTVDRHGNFWMTDVAMHQVSKLIFVDYCLTYIPTKYYRIIIISIELKLK